MKKIKVTWIDNKQELRTLILTNEPNDSLYKHHQDVLANLKNIQKIEYFKEVKEPLFTVEELNAMTFEKVTRIFK